MKVVNDVDLYNYRRCDCCGIILGYSDYNLYHINDEDDTITICEDC